MAELLRCPHETITCSPSLNFEQIIVIPYVINIKLSPPIPSLAFALTIAYTEVGLGVDRFEKWSVVRGGDSKYIDSLVVSTVSEIARSGFEGEGENTAGRNEDFTAY